MTTTMRDGTLNLLKTNSAEQIVADLRASIVRCDLLGMQENTRDHVGKALRWLDQRDDWRVFAADGAAKSNPIAWRPSVFAGDGPGWAVKAHGGHAGITPPRFVVLKPLRHKATGKRVLKINAHCINAFATDKRGNNALRDQLAESYWRTVVDVTEENLDDYDVLLLSGDFNVRLNNLDEPWYPGHLLKPLYRFDHGKGIDHTLVSREADVARLRHFSLGGLFSDHNLHVQVLDLAGRRAEPAPEPAPLASIVTPEQWGSNTSRRATPRTHPIGATRGITAHWEGPRMGDFPHSSCPRKVRTIERFHEMTRGWADLAYNAMVCPHGVIYEGRGPGVRSAANGNSADNDDWYAVCYLGGQGDGFTEAGKRGFLDSFDWLTREGNAGPARNGHRDHKATACPGDEIYRWVHSDAARSTPTRRDWFDMATSADLADVVKDALGEALRNTRFTVRTSKGERLWRLEDLLTHIEDEQDATQKIARKALALLTDPEQLADLVAARINAGDSVTHETVKQAVKDALMEGVR